MITIGGELLNGLTDHEAGAIAALGSRVRLAAGDTLFPLGAPAESLFVVELGRVALTLPMQVRGREEDLLVEEALPGEMLGWSALIPPHHFTLKASASVATDLLSFPRLALAEHFAAMPHVGRTVLENVASVIGRRLQIFQAMWLREMQRALERRCS
jgi:CRP-like cAMP-binding protein